jgi:hypothetical protein
MEKWLKLLILHHTFVNHINGRVYVMFKFLTVLLSFNKTKFTSMIDI